MSKTFKWVMAAAVAVVLITAAALVLLLQNNKGIWGQDPVSGTDATQSGEAFSDIDALKNDVSSEELGGVPKNGKALSDGESASDGESLPDSRASDGESTSEGKDESLADGKTSSDDRSWPGEDPIPEWSVWSEAATDFADAYAVVKDKKFFLYSDASCEKVIWEGKEDWAVQDMVVKDLDRDGAEELILLVWKHGSYGNSKPFWVEENDDRYKQHIFIYSYDLEAESRMNPIWMSSEISFDIKSIAPGKEDYLIVSVKDVGDQLWQWRNFGIKYVSEAESSQIHLLCAGDNLIHLPLLSFDRSGATLYKEIAPVIREADIAAINLETILVSDNGHVSDYPRFGTPLAVGEALTDAGFDVACLANNHVFDQGFHGLTSTVSFFEEKGISYFGATDREDYTGSYKDGVAFIEKNGIKVAFLGYTYGTNGIDAPEEYPYLVETFSDRERMIRQIAYAKGRADVVVVYAHWGEEYQTEPTEEQKELAQFFADQKVDVVIGSHPHVLQGQEVLKDSDTGHETIVYYSLGNFISGQDKEGTKEGGIADLRIAKDTDGSVSVQDSSMINIHTVQSQEGYWVELQE